MKIMELLYMWACEFVQSLWREIRNNCEDASNILFRSDFGVYCPKFDAFMDRNTAYLLDNSADIAAL